MERAKASQVAGFVGGVEPADAAAVAAGLVEAGAFTAAAGDFAEALPGLPFGLGEAEAAAGGLGAAGFGAPPPDLPAAFGARSATNRRPSIRAGDSSLQES